MRAAPYNAIAVRVYEARDIEKKDDVHTDSSYQIMIIHVNDLVNVVVDSTEKRSLARSELSYRSRSMNSTAIPLRASAIPQHSVT